MMKIIDNKLRCDTVLEDTSEEEEDALFQRFERPFLLVNAMKRV